MPVVATEATGDKKDCIRCGSSRQSSHLRGWHRKNLTLRPVWVIEQVLDQPRLNSEMLSQKHQDRQESGSSLTGLYVWVRKIR